MSNKKVSSFIFLACILFLSMQPGQARATRIKDALEKYELSALQLVHSRKNKTCGDFALIVDAEGYGYTVQMGDYVGRNCGRIVEIKKDGILIIKLVQDKSGAFVEKPARLMRKASTQNEQ